MTARTSSAAGPEDEPDERVNGDPDSTAGEDDEEGFDEMADWPEPDFDPEDDPGDDDDDDGFEDC